MKQLVYQTSTPISTHAGEFPLGGTVPQCWEDSDTVERLHIVAQRTASLLAVVFILAITVGTLVAGARALTAPADHDLFRLNCQGISGFMDEREEKLVCIPS